MIIATAIIRFDPEQTEEMLAEAARIDEISRGEVGCRRSDIAMTSRDGELSIVQIWEDMDAFKRHQSSSAKNPDYGRFRELIGELDGSVFDGEPAQL